MNRTRRDWRVDPSKIFFSQFCFALLLLKCLQHDSKLHSTNIIPCLNKTRKLLESFIDKLDR